jgi:hypothetical protein
MDETARTEGCDMSATSVLEWSHSGLQVSAGFADTDRPDVRTLLIGVPNTHDSVRLDWYDGADFTSDSPVPAWLRIGTLPAQEIRLRKGEIVAGGPAEQPQFGPTAAGILRAVAEPLGQFTLVHPDVLLNLNSSVTVMYGKVPKHVPFAVSADEPIPNPFAGAASQYQAAGSALGALITESGDGAQAGAVLGAVVGVLAYLTE